eukprot:4862734-Lingulodinium_polyedra.AAC.1
MLDEAPHLDLQLVVDGGDPQGHLDPPVAHLDLSLVGELADSRQGITCRVCLLYTSDAADDM